MTATWMRGCSSALGFAHLLRRTNDHFNPICRRTVGQNGVTIGVDPAQLSVNCDAHAQGIGEALVDLCWVVGELKWNWYIFAGSRVRLAGNHVRGHICF